MLHLLDSDLFFWAFILLLGLAVTPRSLWLPSIGTRSLLFGAHQFVIHPFVVAYSWFRLFGFPYDPRLWVAFFVHDLGYFGKPNMDGPEGEQHPTLGARIMRRLFDAHYIEPGLGEMSAKQMSEMTDDRWTSTFTRYNFLGRVVNRLFGRGAPQFPSEKLGDLLTWHDFVLHHSRFFAKQSGAETSMLCVADKKAFYTTPRWLYLLSTRLTGELAEYMAGQGARHPADGQTSGEWLDHVRMLTAEWVEDHREGEKKVRMRQMVRQEVQRMQSDISKTFAKPNPFLAAGQIDGKIDSPIPVVFSKGMGETVIQPEQDHPICGEKAGLLGDRACALAPGHTGSHRPAAEVGPVYPQPTHVTLADMPHDTYVGLCKCGTIHRWVDFTTAQRVTIRDARREAGLSDEPTPVEAPKEIRPLLDELNSPVRPKVKCHVCGRETSDAVRETDGTWTCVLDLAKQRESYRGASHAANYELEVYRANLRLRDEKISELRSEKLDFSQHLAFHVRSIKRLKADRREMKRQAAHLRHVADTYHQGMMRMGQDLIAAEANHESHARELTAQRDAAVAQREGARAAARVMRQDAVDDGIKLAAVEHERARLQNELARERQENFDLRNHAQANLMRAEVLEEKLRRMGE